jgi:hypothetical protein
MIQTIATVLLAISFLIGSWLIQRRLAQVAQAIRESTPPPFDGEDDIEELEPGRGAGCWLFTYILFIVWGLVVLSK